MQNLRFFSLFLAIVLIFSAVPISAANKTVFRTSQNEDNYVLFTINGNTLTVEGKIIFDDLEKLWIRSMDVTKLNDYSKLVDVKSGEYFSVSLSLAGITEPTDITVYTKTSSGDERFWGYIWKGVVVEPSGGTYRFDTSEVEEHNRDMVDHWLNPADALGKTSDKVKAMSDQICKGITNVYDKLFAIYKWVTENLYYDYDYYYGKTKKVFYKADDVLDSHVTVCAGYTALLKELLWAQNIPAIETESYAAGVSVGDFDTLAPSATESNHAHTEAWVNGHWVTMDSTWDSENKYVDGTFLPAEPHEFHYFDVSIDTFSLDHKITKRDESTPENTPSDWAQPEVMLALQNDLVPYELQHDYKVSISRHDFCVLLMSVLCHYKGFNSIDLLLKSNGVTNTKSVFVDDGDLSVTAANRLGIVNGVDSEHFAPKATITRQEAATMIRRAAEFLGIHEGNDVVKFTDTAEIPGWASDGINFTSSLVSDHGSHVMGGVGNNKFDPSGTITVQQSILALYRLFDCHQ